MDIYPLNSFWSSPKLRYGSATTFSNDPRLLRTPLTAPSDLITPLTDKLRRANDPSAIINSTTAIDLTSAAHAFDFPSLDKSLERMADSAAMGTGNGQTQKSIYTIGRTALTWQQPESSCNPFMPCDNGTIIA